MRITTIVILALLIFSTSVFAQDPSTAASRSRFGGAGTAIRIACTQSTARVCQHQVNGCFNICNRSNNVVNCNVGCLDRYEECKVNAGCGDFGI